jgi:hypothetical protein
MQTGEVFVERTSLYQENVTDPKLDGNDLLPRVGAEGLPHPSGCLHVLQYLASRLTPVVSQGREHSAKKYNANVID